MAGIGLDFKSSTCKYMERGKVRKGQRWGREMKNEEDNVNQRRKR